LQVHAGGGVDAAGGDEAFFLGLQEAAFPLRALGLALDLGEGAGYAGGIVSSAVDGLRVAEAICAELGEA